MLSLQELSNYPAHKSYGRSRRRRFWYALHRRLWTLVRQARHGLQESDVCALCDQATESISHLFLGCVFSREVWATLLRPLQLLSFVPVTDEDLTSWWLDRRSCMDITARPVFDSLLLLITWVLCKERNCRVFERTPSSPQVVIQALRKEGSDWVLGGLAPLSALLECWSQHRFLL